MCQTGWVERHDTVLVFFDLLPAIIPALQHIKDESIDAETSSTAIRLPDLTLLYA